MKWQPRPSELDLNAEDVGDGTVKVKIELETADGYGFRTTFVLDPEERDQLWEVLKRARARDERPEAVKAIASRRK